MKRVFLLIFLSVYSFSLFAELLTTPMLPIYHNENIGKSEKFGDEVIRYLTEGERNQYKVFIDDGVLKDFKGNLITGEGLYILSAEGDFYFVKNVDDSLVHSAVLGGRPVAGAGETSILNGIITHFDDRSGHYNPDETIFKQAVKFLKQKKVLFAESFAIEDLIKLTKSFEKIKGDWTMEQIDMYETLENHFPKGFDPGKSHLAFEKQMDRLDMIFKIDMALKNFKPVHIDCMLKQLSELKAK